MIRVTQHAILRYRERVADVSAATARSILSSDLITRAAKFGAPYVRLGTGQRIVLDGEAVVTVLPKDTWPGTLGRDRGNS